MVFFQLVYLQFPSVSPPQKIKKKTKNKKKSSLKVGVKVKKKKKTVTDLRINVNRQVHQVIQFSQEERMA